MILCCNSRQISAHAAGIHTCSVRAASRICIAAENLKFMVPVGRRWYLHPEVPRRERETASLLPVLVYCEGAVQLRNIHIPDGVSRLTGQEGVVERNDQPAVKRKKRAFRESFCFRCETVSFAYEYAALVM